ncbi:MAG: cyclic nucleotide-binding domain-containing protein [bacterium]|nr:cyclic nucleotide-binding domain-containing protein [bacterium]
MTIMEKVLALHEVDLFSHMDTEELSILAAIAEEDQYDAGEQVFKEHEATDSLNLILSGKVRVLRGGQEIFVAGPSDTIGALSLLDGQPWLFGAEVTETTEVLRIDRSTFLDVMADHTRITESILRTLVEKIRRLVDTPVSGPPQDS